jgi:DNA repair protein RadD
MMLYLRPYQEAAKAAAYDYLRRRDDNPCVVIPAAGGKTPIMASICRDAVGTWGGRVLVLAHVKELLAQTAEKLSAVCPEVRFGLHSAGLGRRDVRDAVIVAGIQSVYKRACEFDPFDLILVDEAHLIPPDGDGMYRQFLADAREVNPRVRVIGFTATPFRLKDGPICTPGGILNSICYTVGVRELIVGGFLCPLIAKAAVNKVHTDRLHVRGGEFAADEVEQLMDDERLVESACGEIVASSHDRNAVLIFASGVRHGELIVRVLAEHHHVECGFVAAETPTRERDAVLQRFRSGRLKYLCNVNVLTTGFDAPHIDCVALVRPTMSPGLYYQMVGRGFRLHPSKKDCLVLDFGGNVVRHGTVDELRIKTTGGGTGDAPAKECPECRLVIAAGYARCPNCGHMFPPSERRRHHAKPSDVAVLSKKITTTDYTVIETYYSVHTKRKAADGDPRTMRVDYKVGWNRFKSEFICFEHTGYPRHRAAAWWRQRSPDPVPDTAERGVDTAAAGGVAVTKRITIRTIAGEPYERIIGYDLGPVPEPVESCLAAPSDLMSVPF